MSSFNFKYFTVQQRFSAMKVGTDAMVLGALISVKQNDQVLDVGTGTGVISLMLAQQNKTIQITGIDIDSDSSNEARLNFSSSPWSNQLSAVCDDFLVHDFKSQFDLIVSNPPYFSSTNENKDSRKAKARHVSSLQIEPFIDKVNRLLSPKGRFWFIIPYIDYIAWCRSIERNGLFVAVKIDIIGKEGNNPIRCVLKVDRLTKTVSAKQLCVRNIDSSYSDEYIDLTKEFHGSSL